jgi:hypothetical protein
MSYAIDSITMYWVRHFYTTELFSLARLIAAPFAASSSTVTSANNYFTSKVMTAFHSDEIFEDARAV